MNEEKFILAKSNLSKVIDLSVIYAFLLRKKSYKKSYKISVTCNIVLIKGFVSMDIKVLED